MQYSDFGETHPWRYCTYDASICACNFCIYVVKIDIILNYSVINKVTSSWIYKGFYYIYSRNFVRWRNFQGIWGSNFCILTSKGL